MDTSTDSRNDAGGVSLQLRLVCFACLLYVAAAAISASVGRFSDFTAWLLFAQDRWLLLAEMLILTACTAGLGAGRRPIILSARACVVLALAIIPICYLGHAWILCGYDMSRDEQMAVFDSQVFARGLLVQPLPAAWQLHTAALNSLFLLPASHPVGWVSAYLPVNAGVRALVGLVVDPYWAGPILTAVGGIALWNCARRLWPEDKEAATLALLLYVGSGQVLFAGMTAYAMPAHLTLNLLWLWLFLIGRRWADGVALAVGALAVGLHQPLFHPMFVAPFVVLLLWQRAWKRAALFILGYGVICAFWFAWPHWMYARIEGARPYVAPADTDFWARLRAALASPASARWTDMAANLLRFAAWQPILLLPLFLIGLATVRRNAIVMTLAATVVLPVIVMAVLLPDQGQGFGYRYLHGVIGAVILVALHGWRATAGQETRWRHLLGRSLIVGGAISFSLQAFMTHSYHAGVAAVEARIATSGTDYFIIGNDDAPASGGMVLNRPDLSNRPIRLFADRVDPDLIRLMCMRHGKVGMPTSALYAPVNAYFRGTIISLSSDRRVRTLAPQLLRAGCSVRVLGGAA